MTTKTTTNKWGGITTTTSFTTQKRNSKLPTALEVIKKNEAAKNEAAAYKTWTTATLLETQSNYLNAMTHYNREEKKTPGCKLLRKRMDAITTELQNREYNTAILNNNKYKIRSIQRNRGIITQD